MIVCSFDIGKGNLALVIMEINIQNNKLNLEKLKIIDYDLIDLSNPNKNKYNIYKMQFYCSLEALLPWKP